MEGGEEELTKERTGEKRPLRAWRGPRAWGVGGREGEREGGREREGKSKTAREPERARWGGREGGREGEGERGRKRMCVSTN